MYHTYPYKAQIPVLIEGKYQKRIFTSDKEVWDVIQLIIDETKQENKKGGNFEIASSVMSQLPFFACINTIMDNNAQKDISRYMYSKQFQISPYKGSYGDQPRKWIEKSFVLNNLIERQKAKAIKNGSN